MPATDRNSNLASLIVGAQGVYYLISGIWPILSIETFQMVTGPKTDHLNTERGDHWLVITVGALVLAIAMSLFWAVWRREILPPTIVLSLGGALALATVDVVYVSRHAIMPIYLLDFAVEMGFVGGWLLVFFLPRKSRSELESIESEKVCPSRESLDHTPRG